MRLSRGREPGTNPEEGNGKPPLRSAKKTNMTTNLNISAMVLDGETLRPKGTLSATGEEQGMRPNRATPNDVMAPNPSGRVITDESRLEKRVLSCKTRDKIGTWNVRSMYDGKLDIVLSEMSRTGIALLGISELRWIGKGHLQSGEYRILYSGHDSRKKNGVAVICNKRICIRIQSY
jgi:hypothetical protein